MHLSCYDHVVGRVTYQVMGWQLLAKLPSTVDPTTVTFSNSPNGGDAKALVEIKKFKVGQIGLKLVQYSIFFPSSLLIRLTPGKP